MISLEAVTALHRDCVARWHEQEIDNPYDGFLRNVCEQLSYNFRLWHEEDKPVADGQRYRNRAGEAGDRQAEPAAERLDREARRLGHGGAEPPRRRRGGQCTTKHGDDWQRDRPTVDSRPADLSPYRAMTGPTRRRSTAKSVARKWRLRWHSTRLVSCRPATRRRPIRGPEAAQDYRQLKMYNDPALNPYLYKAKGVSK